jgi:hypothetical protein
LASHAIKSALEFNVCKRKYDRAMDLQLRELAPTKYTLSIKRQRMVNDVKTFKKDRLDQKINDDNDASAEL